MELFQVDDHARLFISPAIENWDAVARYEIMIELGMPGPDVVARLRERRPGALFNDGFAAYLEALNPTVQPT